ncbi:chemotaxis protein CheW [Chloroflexota bacterium]
MSVQVTEDEELVAEEVEADQYLVFTAQSQELGVQAMRVQEISQVLPVSHVPNAPSYIEGIMNLRGRIASVINFRKKFGFEPKEHDEDTRVIVVELDSYPIGITVDSVEEVVKIPDSLVQELPESTSTAESKEYITGIGMLDKRLIILLDLDKVLTGAALINMDELNQAISKIQTVEMPEPDTTQTDAAQPSELVTDKMQAVKKPEKVKPDILDTEPPVDTGKRQLKRRAE